MTASKLPPAVSGKKAVQAANKASSNLRAHRQGLFDQNNSVRSLPPSPSLSGRTPVPGSSKPTTKQLRLDALKTSLIHLLAIRAVSEQYIVKTLNCGSDDIKELLEKYGRPSRLDAKKFDLSDRGYKELDVWTFGYKDESDRQAAIDRAIAAFDRQRISVREKVWQKLMSEDERRSGRILSKHNFHEGPVERVKTPQIHIQPFADKQVSGEASPVGASSTTRLAPNTAMDVRTDSQPQGEKSKEREKEAQSIGLLADPSKENNDRSAASVSKPNSRKAPKKTAPKASTSTNSKIKSKEFISDSDESSEAEDTPIALTNKGDQVTMTSKSTSKASESTRKQVARPASHKTVKSASSSSSGASRPASAKKTTQKSPVLKPIPVDASGKSIGVTKPFPRNRATSSPLKPSRLGSSPPTNASDFDNDGANKSPKSSSSSNSPLINQRRNSQPKRKVGPALSTTSAIRQTPLQNGISSSQHAHKRVPSTSSSKGPSEATVSRSRDGKGSTAVAASSKREREHERDKREPEPPAKRRLTASPQHLAEPQRPATATAKADMPQKNRDGLSRVDLQSARRFKEMQLRYSTQLKELRGLSSPPAERVEKLRRMYSKLAEHKQSLLKLAAT